MPDVTKVADSTEMIQLRWGAQHLVDVNATLQYLLSDPLEGDADAVYVVFTNGVATATVGTSPTPPDVTLRMSAANYLKIANDDPTFKVRDAYGKGLIRFEGNGVLLRSLFFAHVKRDKAFTAKPPKPLITQTIGDQTFTFRK